MSLFGRRNGVFADQFRCHSVSLLAAEQQRDPARLEYSDKIILPPSCLEKLAQLEIQYPMMFEATNPRYVARRLHCGVLEFIAQEGMVYLPFWMMENMHLNEGDIVSLRSSSISKGRFVKLQPQTTDFIKISNPKAVLEQSLRNFSALTKGETFRILYNKRKYDIGVVEVRPEGPAFAPGAPEAVCIIEADVEVCRRRRARALSNAPPPPRAFVARVCVRRPLTCGGHARRRTARARACTARRSTLRPPPTMSSRRASPRRSRPLRSRRRRSPSRRWRGRPSATRPSMPTPRTRRCPTRTRPSPLSDR